MSPIRKRKSPKIERGLLFVSAGHTHSSKTIFKSWWCFMGKRENADEKRAIVIFPKNCEEETGAPTITTTVVAL